MYGIRQVGPPVCPQSHRDPDPNGENPEHERIFNRYKTRTSPYLSGENERRQLVSVDPWNFVQDGHGR